MQIWLDTCDCQFISKALSLGIVYGITTNPSILANSKENHKNIIHQLLEIQEGPVAVQIMAENAEEMIEQALALHQLSSRILVKIPLVQEGLTAMKALIGEGVAVMATAIFNPAQALLAAIVGANYIAPYFGRMLDEGFDAFENLETIVKIYKKNDYKTKVLVAALRTTEQITACAALGVAAVTLKQTLFSQFTANDPFTLKALNVFLEDWHAKEKKLLCTV